MDGIGLSRRYFQQAALPLLRIHAPRILGRCAAGLCSGGLDVGCGSEIYGYDDRISRDHNWGPRFFLFLNEEDYAAYATGLRGLLAAGLPTSFEGFSIHPTTSQATHFHITTPRRNALAALGVESLPANDEDWFFIPESKLCEYAAGSIYYDPLEMVSTYKRRLAAYPPNVLYKRLAGAFFMTHTAGNACRCAARREWGACRSYLSAAVGATQRAALLLGGKFPPHVKWRGRAFTELPNLPEGLVRMVERLSLSIDSDSLREDVPALLTPLGEMANASGMIEPQPLRVENDFLAFPCYAFSRAFEAKIAGPLAGRPLAIALDQMAEGFLPYTREAIEAHWRKGRPGISGILLET